MSILPVVLLVVGLAVMTVGTFMLCFRLFKLPQNSPRLALAGCIVLLTGGAIGVAGCICGIIVEALTWLV